MLGDTVHDLVRHLKDVSNQRSNLSETQLETLVMELLLEYINHEEVTEIVKELIRNA